MRRISPAMLLAALLAVSAAPRAFAADVEARGPVNVSPVVVAGMPDFNGWLVNLNSGLNLPPRDLAAISLEASQALRSAPAGASVAFDAQAKAIQIVPRAASAQTPAGALPALPVSALSGPAAAAHSIPLASLPALRENLAAQGAQGQKWLAALSRTQDPSAVAESLNAFFEGSLVLNPQAHTADVLAGKLPESVRAPYDATAAGRQREALQAWQKSPQRTYVLVNSYSFKDDGTPGLNYYDMRSLAQILWASDPGVNVIFVTAMPIDESMIKHVLRGHKDAAEIRKRVHFVALGDEGTDFLSQKLLDPKHAGKLGEIRDAIARIGAPAVLYPYMGGPYEWQIARELGIPNSVYAAHPSMIYWGTKSGGRKVFKAALSRYKGTKKVRIKLADGAEDVYSPEAAARASEALVARHPESSRVAVKLNLGSSGEGNLFPTVTDWHALPAAAARKNFVDKLAAAKVGVPNEDGSIDTFATMMANEGAAVEEFIPGIDRATFPSVQSEIRPDGSVHILSSHEQILIDGNNYIGANLSADKAYRKVIERAAYEAATELARQGVVGRFGTDFAAIPQKDGGYDVYYIENNIRLTGTTHPLVAAAGLTGGVYQYGALRHETVRAPIRYKSMDHDVRPNLVGMSVDHFLDFFERPDNQDVQFDPQKRAGVLFHLVPAVKAAGNVGYTIIAESRKAVQAIQDRLTELLNKLELEYLSGKRENELTYRYEGHDSRVEVEAKIGHVKTVKAFAAFLRRHPTHVFVRASKAGIVFHPHGYTVVGRNRDEVMYLNATARRLLRQFAEESTRL